MEMEALFWRVESDLTVPRAPSAMPKDASYTTRSPSVMSTVRAYVRARRDEQASDAKAHRAPWDVECLMPDLAT